MNQTQLPGMSIPGRSFEPAKMDTPRAVMSGKPVFVRAAKSVINFESAFEHKLLCDGPTFSAGDACNYSCTYCYVGDILRKLRATPVMAGIEGRHEDIVVRRANAVQIVHEQLCGPRGPKYLTPGDRRVIYSSPLVDVAGNLDLVKETAEICVAILEYTNWQIRLLSKSCFLPSLVECIEERVRELGMYLRPQAGNIKQRLILGVSTGTLNDDLGKCIEAGTALVSRRIKSLHWLQDRGFRTFGMACPSLPQADYGRFTSQMANALRVQRCEHLWAEVINLRGESFTRTREALRVGGFSHEADLLEAVTNNREAWELYARHTFEAWRDLPISILSKGKLRFLQYVTPASRAWWTAQAGRGAVVL